MDVIQFDPLFLRYHVFMGSLCVVTSPIYYILLMSDFVLCFYARKFQF